MKKILTSWRWGNRIVATVDFERLKFSLVKGYIESIRWYFKRTSVNGAFQLYGTRWFGIVSNNGELFFIHKDGKIKFNEILECTNQVQDKINRKLKIRTKSNQAFEFKYKSFGARFVNKYDSAYDLLDEEADDMLFSLSLIVGDEERVNQLLDRWS